VVVVWCSSSVVVASDASLRMSSERHLSATLSLSLSLSLSTAAAAAAAAAALDPCNATRGKNDSDGENGQHAPYIIRRRAEVDDA
jgi:hypothetical protein